MKKGKKIAIIIIVAVMIIAVVVAAILIFRHNGERTVQMELKSTETIGPQDTKYTFDGSFVSNVPLENYRANAKVPADAVVVDGLKEGNYYEKNTALIQDAIDSIRNDGGTVYIPAGDYLVRTINLYSDITLFIDPECTLTTPGMEEYNGMYESVEAVISAKNKRNVKITGGGTINGFGRNFYEQNDSEPFYALKSFNLFTKTALLADRRLALRENARNIKLVQFKECTNVNIDGLVLKDAPGTALRFYGGKRITVKNVVVNNNAYIGEGTGIEAIGSRTASIENCFVFSGGNAVEINSPYESTADIEIKNCEFGSLKGCVAIGSESVYNIQKVEISDCSFFVPAGLSSDGAGLTVASADGAKVSQISMKNVKMDGVASPLLVWLGNRLSGSKDEPGSVHDITLSNIESVNADEPISIAGIEGHEVYDVTLENVELSYRNTAEDLDVQDHALTAGEGLEPALKNVSTDSSAVYSAPKCGIFTKNAKNIKVTGFKCTPRTENALEVE